MGLERISPINFMRSFIEEEIIRLNDHKSGDKSKECYFNVFMQRLF
jgi:hypothetical protein